MKKKHYRALSIGLCLTLCLACWQNAGGEAMLELFQQNWSQVTQKMPELAEAGYDSLWLPNPCKGNGGTFSIGYDPYDPFDLGNKNQQGTTATKYGTEAQLLQMVQTAHRFGIRIYFDNVMNHRSSVVPGYPGSNTATNYYPGMWPQDFHLQVVSGGYQNWASISCFCDQFEVQNNPLLGLIDIANEPGSINDNFGTNYGDTITKPIFVRHPNDPEYYLNPSGPSLGGPWHPFYATGGTPIADDVNSYLIRAAMWTLYTTKCDGFRFDAVKHVPSGFFGANPGASVLTDEPTFAGYTGGIQAMYDYTHGYGSNVTGNGYAETDGNRNSLFNTEAARNDAMLFGEHVAPVPDFQEYLDVGMRLINQPLYNQFNAAIGNYGGSPGLFGMDGRDYAPPAEGCYTSSSCNTGDSYPCYSAAQSVMMAMTQDGGNCCPANETLEDSYFFMHEGLPMVYSDGYNHNTNSGTPIVSYANYLGENGDNSMPDTMYTHNQLARGGTWSRWSDQNVVLFERYDYREGNSSEPQTQDVALYGMNDDGGDPGDISFDDGVNRTSDGYYLVRTNTVDGSASADTSVPNSRGQGIVVGFAPGSVLVQLSSSADVAGGKRAFHRLLVHGATTSTSTATSSANNADPAQRLIYVGSQTLASGGGAIELVIPSEAWVVYGYQWPEASRANPSTNAIMLVQGGNPVPRITIYRQDGPNGQAAYNPLFPYKMRGSVDPYTGNPIGASGEGNVSNLTYAFQIPVVTNAPFNIIARNDASSANTLIKLDGGVDLNSQMGLGPTNFQAGIAPTNFLDLRDNPPGYADDVFLGYEQTAFDFRNGPEKFGARNILSNNIVSLGAETYYYNVGGTNTIVFGSGFGESITNQTADWVYHDPTNTVNALGTVSPTQMYPLNPMASQSVQLWVKVGYQFQINTGNIYYTIDGSNPEGAFGVGEGTTLVAPLTFANHDSTQMNIDWWQGAIPAQATNTQVRYKVALYYNGIQAISDAEVSGSKLYGLNESAITNFNPTAALVWLHNDLNTNNTTTGLQEGLHIIRARTFLPRTGQSSVYNTFLQTFYYDAGLPSGVIASPAADGNTVTNTSYTVVVRADSSTTGVTFNIADSSTNNDDVLTGQSNGNGSSNGVPIFVNATLSTNTPALDQLYPNLPQEFHFNYAGVPSNGMATITVKLTKLTSGLYPNRFTTLARTINTAAPAQGLTISSPASPGQQVILNPGQPYTIMACFTSTLDTNNINEFSIYINGVLQPRNDTNGIPTYVIGGSACGLGQRTLSYTFAPQSGTNNLEVDFNGAVSLSATSSVIVSGFEIISIANGLILWQSAPGLDYQVWATTDLRVPFAPISPVIQASGSSTYYFDSNQAQSPTNEFYQVQIVPQ